MTANAAQQWQLHFGLRTHSASRIAGVLPVANFEMDLHRQWENQAREQQRRLFRQLHGVRGLWPRTNSREVRRRVRHVLQSVNCQWLSLYEAMKAPGSHARRNEFICRYAEQLDECLRTGTPDSRLDPWRPSHEAIRCRRERKLDGTYRALRIFGRFMRGRHRLPLEILKALIAPDFFRYQWMHMRRSRADLIAQIRAICADGRWTHVAVLDISDFFGSISHAFLREYLPFPVEVVDNTIITPLNREGGHGRSNYDDVSSGRSLWASLALLNRDGSLPGNQRGVAQGASCSPLIAYSILENVLAAFALGTPIVQWGDDIVISGCSEAEVTDTSLRLIDGLRNHPAGPLILRTKQRGQIREGFDFHGHRFAPIGQTVSINLSRAAQDRFFQNLEDYIAEDRADGDQTFASARDYVNDWLRQALCDERFSLARQAASVVDQTGSAS